jgi:LysR family glycine cleavage system transcriptional activator
VKGIDLRTGPRFTSSDLCLRAAAHGLGVALARERLAEDDVDCGLLFRPFGSARVSLPRAYWLVQPAHGDMRPAVHAVAEWIKQQTCLPSR